MTAPSDDPDATRLPSGENATELTQSEWPFNVLSCAPVSASQSMTRPSWCVVVRIFPSGEKRPDTLPSGSSRMTMGGLVDVGSRSTISGGRFDPDHFSAKIAKNLTRQKAEFGC